VKETDYIVQYSTIVLTRILRE